MVQWRARTRLPRSVVIALSSAMLLVACGEMPAPVTEVPPPPAISPEAGQVPENTAQSVATIRDGVLEPDRFAGTLGSSFQLVITGDGTPHTLAIADLVAATPVAAEGETTISFTVEGDPAEAPITLDGNEVGIFEKQSASGATSP